MGGLLVTSAALFAFGAWALSLYAGTFQAGPPRTVAAALAEYHQAAVMQVLAAPTLTGTLVVTLPSWKPAGPFASCADNAGVVATFSTPELVPDAPRVAAALASLEWDAAGYGLSQGGIVLQRTGAAIPIPCTVPDGRVVAVTRTR